MEMLLKRTEAAKVLDINVSTLDKWTREKGIPFLKIGKAVRYKHTDLIKWAEKFKEGE